MNWFSTNHFSAISWQLTLSRPDVQKETEENEGEGDLCVLIFGSLVTSDKVVSLYGVLVFTFL